eukprot:scaffold2.g7002.t1
MSLPQGFDMDANWHQGAGMGQLSRAASDVAPRTAGAGAWHAPAPASADDLQRALRSPAARRRSSVCQLPPAQRVRLAVGADPLAYLSGLGKLAPTARPSSLQPLLQRGRCAPSSLCAPSLDATGLGWADLEVDRRGQLVPTEAVAQCRLELGAADGLPPAGARDRAPWLSAARLCLFDGARFHGNVVKPKKVKTAQKSGEMVWKFGSGAAVLVRCPAHLVHTMQARGLRAHAKARPDVYIEFCVSHELTPEEGQRLPAGGAGAAAARQCDEVCIAWALVELCTLHTLHTARSLSLPLCGGPLSQRQTLAQCAAAASPQGHTAWPVVGGRATLSLRLSPVPSAAAAETALLPAATVACPQLVQVVGLYRQMLAEAVPATEEGGQPACCAAVADQVLAALPAILDDPDLADAFFSLWERHTAPRARPTRAELRTALRTCATLVWAMTGSQAVPPPGIANALAQRQERRGRMAAYLGLHPVEGVGGGAHGWLHRPFDAAELVVRPPAAAAMTV